MKPVLIEKCPGNGDPYVTKWYCDPPDEGEPFTVLKEKWCHDYTVRKIFKVQVTEKR